MKLIDSGDSFLKYEQIVVNSKLHSSQFAPPTIDINYEINIKMTFQSFNRDISKIKAKCDKEIKTEECKTDPSSGNNVWGLTKNFGYI